MSITIIKRYINLLDFFRIFSLLGSVCETFVKLIKFIYRKDGMTEKGRKGRKEGGSEMGFGGKIEKKIAVDK